MIEAPTNPAFICGDQLYSAWSLHLDTPPVPAWTDGDPVFAAAELRPGKVVGLAGAPGAGKTALACQVAFEAARRAPELRVLIANVEMAAEAILDRQLLRVSGVPPMESHRGATPSEVGRLAAGRAAVHGLLPRIAFAADPNTMDGIYAAAKGFGAHLLLIDYVQRVRPRSGVASGDDREAINAIVSDARSFAKAGACVLLVSAVRRSGGSGYGRVGLASSRGSSEIEFGVDDMFGLYPEDDDFGTDPEEPPAGAAPPPRRVVLDHLKNRYGAIGKRTLEFAADRQLFSVAAPSVVPRPHLNLVPRPEKSTEAPAAPKGVTSPW